MYTKPKNKRPGKFEGEHSQLISEAVYRASLDGANDEYGSMDFTGFWAGLVLGRKYGFTIIEDTYGFVYVTAFNSHQAAAERFDHIVQGHKGE